MARDVIQLPADGPGKKLDVYSVTGAGGATAYVQALTLADSTGTLIAPATAAGQASQLAQLQTLNSLVPATYDYISLGYTGTDLTSVVFKTGGSGGSTVSTLTLAYSSGVLQSVTKT